MKSFSRETEKRKEFVWSRVEILKKRHKILSDLSHSLGETLKESSEQAQRIAKTPKEKVFKDLEIKLALRFEKYFRENYVVVSHFLTEVRMQLEEAQIELQEIMRKERQEVSKLPLAKRPEKTAP